MPEEFNEMQMVVFRALPPERVYQMFVGMFPPEYAAQLDIMLLKGVEPEVIFELPSAADIPPVIKEVTLAALRWRKGQLISSAPNN